MIVNQTQLSDIVGFSTPTIRAWERDEMPVLEKGKSGQSSKYDTSAVIEWMVSREAAQIDSDEDGNKKISELEAKRRKAVADARKSEIQLDRLRGGLIEIELVGKELDRVFERVRTLLIAMPGDLAKPLTDEPKTLVVQEKIFEKVTQVLDELSRGDFTSAGESFRSLESVDEEELVATTKDGSG